MSERLYFNIRVAYGSDRTVRQFHFVAKDQTLDHEVQIGNFDAAVKELNRIYEDYGRFATIKGVCALFRKFGFEEYIP
jgi:hypothetical protein